MAVSLNPDQLVSLEELLASQVAQQILAASPIDRGNFYREELLETMGRRRRET